LFINVDSQLYPCQKLGKTNKNKPTTNSKEPYVINTYALVWSAFLSGIVKKAPIIENVKIIKTSPTI
jgi:hypothetical protein